MKLSALLVDVANMQSQISSIAINSQNELALFKSMNELVPGMTPGTMKNIISIHNTLRRVSTAVVVNALISTAVIAKILEDRSIKHLKSSIAVATEEAFSELNK